jgi:AraC-like DNA-binding protein
MTPDTADRAPPLTVSVAFVRGMLSGLLARGIACDEWLHTVGITPERLREDDARVTLSQYSGLLRLLIESRDDEALGLLARPSRRGSFALQVRSAIGAPSLEVAIRRVARTCRLLHDDVSLELVRDGPLAGVVLHVHESNAAANAFLHELFLRVYWRLFAWLVGGLLPPVRFDFAFSRPPYAEGYSRIFPAPWRFDADRSAMWFEEARLRLPVCRDEGALRTFIADGPANVIVPSRDVGFAGRVRVYLQHTQPSWPDLERTARALNTSASSLQRHLAGENTSFQALKDQLRRDIAIFRLNTSKVPLVKLAAELGFADAAAFQRAFKSWTGCPPGVYRRAGGASRGTPADEAACKNIDGI